MDKNALIAQIKIFVYSGIPAIFGFSIHEGAEQAGQIPTSGQLWQAIQQLQPEEQLRSHSKLTNHLHHINKALGLQKMAEPEEDREVVDPDKHFCIPGNIPFPTFGEIYTGGHAAVVVGYNDEKIIVNRQPLRRCDRDKLNLPVGNNLAPAIRAFLLTEHGQWEEYRWQPGDQDNDKKRYVRVTSSPLDFKDFQFMKQPDFNGLFILLIKRQPNKKPSNHLVPRDILFESIDTVGIDEPVVDEYLATKGAFKIRNSWSKTWGDQGYGWLPYAYVYQDLTFDWWSILKFEWMNTDSFGLLRTGNNLVMCDNGKTGPDDGC
jgi:hypothetical protein